MVPIPFEFTYEYWVTGPTDTIMLSCLMPNGNIILLPANSNATFAEIKEVLIQVVFEMFLLFFF